MTDTPPLRRALEGRRWEGVELLAYKNEGAAPFKGVTRQTIAREGALNGELRYFEVEPRGWSTLERHEHMHSVMIFEGHGSALVGDQVFAVGPHDLVTIPAWTWHQFRSAPDAPLGFLCLVNVERDRPQLPNGDDLAELRAKPEVARFLDGAG